MCGQCSHKQKQVYISVIQVHLTLSYSRHQAFNFTTLC